MYTDSYVADVVHVLLRSLLQLEQKMGSLKVCMAFLLIINTISPCHASGVPIN